MKGGDILITTKEINNKLPEELEMEKDVVLHEWKHINEDSLLAVALFQKNESRRLAKPDSQVIVNTLEDITGYCWYVDHVSNFVIHLADGEIPIKS